MPKDEGVDGHGEEDGYGDGLGALEGPHGHVGGDGRPKGEGGDEHVDGIGHGEGLEALEGPRVGMDMGMELAMVKVWRL